VRGLVTPAHDLPNVVFSVLAGLVARRSRVERCSPQPTARRDAAAFAAARDVCVQRSRACACAATSPARRSRYSSALCRPRCPVRFTSPLSRLRVRTKRLLALQRRTAIAACRCAACRYSLSLAACFALLTRRTLAYVEAVRDIVAALTDTITFEASGASEREVRRRADPAKASIERFLRDWKGSPLVSSQPSYVALVGAWQEQ
jgi:hypothetical protein